MKVTAKLVGAFLVGMVIVTCFGTWLEIRRESREFYQLVDQESRTIGQFFERAINRAWEIEGQDGAMSLLNNLKPARQEFVINWVWFDAASGDYRPLAPAADVQSVLINQRPSVIVQSARQPIICDYWPIDVPGARAGGLQFAKPATALRDVRWAEIYEMLAFIGWMILISGLIVAAVGVRYVGRPLQRLIVGTGQLAKGDFETRVELHSHDELSQLADSFNEMCVELKASRERLVAESTARLAATEQLRHVDRLKTVGRLASGVAHELGTPLNVVSGRAQLIAGGKLPEAEVVTSARTIQQEARRMTIIIRNLLDFARRRPPHRAPVDVRSVVDRSTKLLETIANKSGVSINVTTDAAPCIANIDAGQIEQVLSNVIMNAIQAMPEGGAVEVDVGRRRTSRIEAADQPPREYVCVNIRDHGAGVSADTLPHLFEPFFTTKAVGQGTGLGLSISYGIIQEHGGFIDVQSRPGEGSCFGIFLPIGDAP